MRIGDCQGIFQYSLDRAPDVDDLVSALEELGCVFWEMEGDSAFSCGVGLINVDALDWTSKFGTSSVVIRCSTDGVVEDEDSRGTSAMTVNLGLNRAGRCCVRVFEQLLRLWIILSLNLLIV
jgi:hypothetical protein